MALQQQHEDNHGKNNNTINVNIPPENTSEQIPVVDGDALVPQLASHQITERELATCCRVLDAVASLKKLGKSNKHNNNNNNNNNNKKRGADADGNDSSEAHQQQEQQPVLDGLELYKSKNLRPLRKALANCLELHKRTMFNGKEEEQHFEERRQQRSLKRQKVVESALHQKYLASTELRKGRVDRLQQLQQDAKEEELSKRMIMANYMIPDGHVNSSASNHPALLPPSEENGDNNNNNEGVKADNEEENAQTRRLPKLRSCYVCKVRYRELHHFYDQLCPSCAALNWQKRYQTANLRGRVAVVTGSRVKIGYQVCLKLLRAGAHVVATTRFPNAAVAAYRQEPDFDEFGHRLQLFGLDLRDITGLEAFTRFLKQKFPRGIDIVINNACQTVRRPVAYYASLVEREQELYQNSDAVHRHILAGCLEFERLQRRIHNDDEGDDRAVSSSKNSLRLSGEAKPPILPLPCSSSSRPTESSSDQTLAVNAATTAAIVAPSSHKGDKKAHFESTGLSHSAEMSQLILLPEDAGISEDILPPGVTDINGQQLDLRTTNSWMLKMEEVSTPEVVECMFINAIAPFVLNSRLKPLMTTPQDESRPDRYIINVSAMEGKFYRYKMPNHPHTNMAKAALNMLTRTSAEDLATKHRIFMNSVDTGWINDENPLEKARKTAETNLFQTPIDEIDAAARIVDPIFVGVASEATSSDHQDRTPPIFGKFLKDYHETEW